MAQRCFASIACIILAEVEAMKEATKVESFVEKYFREKGFAQGLEEGRTVGRAEGRAEGRTAGRAEMLNAATSFMKEIGISADIISKFTDSSLANA